jgi:hypothetical protein
MVSVKARRYAAPMLVAGAGVLASATTAHAAGGLSVTPAVIEHTAKRGIVGRMTLTNSTNEKLRVRVTVRPWRQQLDGTVIADMRSNFTRYVKAGKRKFTLRAGAKRTFRLKMRRRTRSGSLYGSIDIFGKPTRRKGRTGIIPQYRLISKIRLNPKRKRYKLRTGAVQVRRGQILLPIRNLGNTIDPLAGNFRISGPTSRSGDFKAIPALPGKLIALGAGASRGMPKGRYTLTATVTQAGRNKNVRSSFRIR